MTARHGSSGKIMKRNFITSKLSVWAILLLTMTLVIGHHQFIKAETTNLCFAVISDTHIGGSNSYEVNFKNALMDINDIDKNCDALCMCGDITDYGQDSGYDSFYNILKGVPHAKPYVIVGNHDVRKLNGGYEEAKKRFLAKTGMRGMYHDTWIKGYHFIFLATEKDLKDQALISDDQITWLSKKMAERSSPTRPIFVFLHQPMVNTVAGTYPDSKYSMDYDDGVVLDQRLRDLLREYPQSFLFTGHTHEPLESPNPNTVFTQNGNTMVNVPSTAYNINGPENEGFFVEVYSDRVVLKGRNFNARQWVSSALYTIGIPPVTTRPTITTTNSNYLSGQDITIRFSNGPGNSKDWIGLYQYGGGSSAYLKRLYVNRQETATTGSSAGIVVFSGGLTIPGTYTAKFFRNDGYEEICRDLSFVVYQPSASISIISMWSNMAMDLFNNTTDDNATIGQWTSHGENNQKWKIIQSAEKGYDIIISTHSNKCLDIFKTNGGYFIVQNKINSKSDSQKWKLIKVNSGVYKIVSKIHNMAIDIENSSKEKGAKLLLNTTNNKESQLWQVR
jgi:3',5'-cyclic-AMP phosphodiesterase